MFWHTTLSTHMSCIAVSICRPSICLSLGLNIRRVSSGDGSSLCLVPNTRGLVSKLSFVGFVANMRLPTRTYLCTDETCLSTDGVSYYGVYKKFLTSLMNCITYQSIVSKQSDGHKRTLEDANSLFTALLDQARQQKKVQVARSQYW